MLKLETYEADRPSLSQPPSGGCVLKPYGDGAFIAGLAPAAFRRLCVETTRHGNGDIRTTPAAFRRLCVETVFQQLLPVGQIASRLQAAVC